MDKNLKILLIVFACSVLALVGTITGYNIFHKPITAKTQETQEIQESLAAGSLFTPIPSFIPSMAKIRPGTKMVYEYVYSEDGTIETTEENAPYFLLNMDEGKLASVFTDWDIVEFSEDNVIMRKTIEGSSIQHYIVGVQDGFISVFYQKPVNGTTLKEITSTPVNALSDTEQERLNQGVLVTGEEELIRILEDFSS